MSCILHHQGVHLILAYSWARPAILVAGKGKGEMFYFFCFFTFIPVPLSSLSLSFISSTISSLFSLSLGDKAQTAMQQHGEHDKAQQKSGSSTASGLSSRCPGTILPLDPARSGRESVVDSACLSLTIIQFSAHVISISNTHSQQAHICNTQKPCGDGRAAKQQVRKHWKL